MEESQVVGCLLGTAVGDALGLPYEGVSRQRAPRLLGKPDRYRFLLRYGMVSDGTEHSCMVAQSLIASGGNAGVFAKDLGTRFRWWFASMPAGLGKATMRACVKLWCGVSPQRSGVFSAGNGPAMRSAILGVACDDLDRTTELVSVSARMTHSDPKAEFGAIAVALAARHACEYSEVDGAIYLEQLGSVIGTDGSELISLLNGVLQSVDSAETTAEYALKNGHERGVSGYTYHTVPVVVHAWLSHPRDFRAAVVSCIECGGDADTTAAIVGGIVGAATGEAGIPVEWISGIKEWPRSVSWIRRLSSQVHNSTVDGCNQSPPRLNFFASLLRNVVFFVVVLLHGLRRLLPPY